MSPQEARAFVERVFEPVNAGRFEDYNHDVTAGFVSHGPRGDMDSEGMKKLHMMVRSGLPDWHLVVEDAFSCGDRVGVRGTFRGTHRGTFMGKAPTGKLLEWRYIALWRISGGKVAEEWFLDDDLGLQQQLGVIPRAG